MSLLQPYATLLYRYKQWLRKSQVDRHQLAAPDDEASVDPAGLQVVYSTRFGGLVEFPDDETAPTSNKHTRKGFRRRPTNVTDPGNNLVPEQAVRAKRKFTVTGTRRWEERASSRQREKTQLAEARKIRQPKGGRTFGQLRRPEQVLKQRRQRMKMNHAAQKKKFKGSKLRTNKASGRVRSRRS
ncbi:unnamed protein product [Dicrocoelium dendriticum]|nr:unnamed protein product [Dicrocoelium dendriticum]